MNGLAMETIWRDFQLDAVDGPDDLDARLDLLIEALPPLPRATPRLAAALGLTATELRRRAGVPVAEAVAAARLRLIGAALGECRTRAEAGEGARLRHALAVCAALQWDALGEAGMGTLAFVRREAVLPTADHLAGAVRAALAQPRPVALARIRALAVAAVAVAA